LLPDGILSAADGRVCEIKSLTFEELLKQPGITDLNEHVVRACWSGVARFWLISVVMSLLDVHVNRAPVSGKVISTIYKSGMSFPISYDDRKGTEKNARNTIFIGNERIRIAVVQISGHLARKIECWVTIGDLVAQGDRIGWIRLGSEVKVIFPAAEGQEICVKEGSQVKAELTPLVIPSVARELVFTQSTDQAGDIVAHEAPRKLFVMCLNVSLHTYLHAKRALFAILRRRIRSNGSSD